MGNHQNCAGFVIACMDYRIQKAVDDLIDSLINIGRFDRVSVAGGAGNTGVLFDQIIKSLRLHRPELVVLVAHEECGDGATRKDLIRNFIRLSVWLPEEDEVRAFWLRKITDEEWVPEEVILSDAQRAMVAEMRRLRIQLMNELVG